MSQICDIAQIPKLPVGLGFIRGAGLLAESHGEDPAIRENDQTLRIVLFGVQIGLKSRNRALAGGELRCDLLPPY